MSKLLFEEFLVSLFSEYLERIGLESTKYHYVCSDPEQGKRLFKAFGSYVNGFKQLQIDGVTVNYIETKTGIKLIVMLHHNGDEERDTYNEDFIANVRDALNEIPRAALLVIHNSSLDTILTSCQSLSVKGNIFTPEYVYGKINELGKEHPYPILINVLCEKHLIDILEQNLSVFGCRSLYDSVVNQTVDFLRQGLFEDKRLFDTDSKKEIHTEVKNNSQLFSSIKAVVDDFSDDETELTDRLESLNLSEKFINQNFIGSNKDKWKHLSYSEIDTERNNNQERKLAFDSIELDGKRLGYYKRESESGAKSKKLTVLIETDIGEHEIKFRFDRSSQLLRENEVRVVGDYGNHDLNPRVSNHQNQSFISSKIQYDGGVKLFQLRLSRSSSSENFQFNCLVIENKSFNISKCFERLAVVFNRNKAQVLLENVTTPLVLKPEQNRSLVLDQGHDLEVDITTFGTIDFREYLKTESTADVVLKCREQTLPVTVIGQISLESIKLPSILDVNRSETIYSIDGNAQYRVETQRAVLSGKEKELSVEAKLLCRIEYDFIQRRLVHINESTGEHLSNLDLRVDFPSVADAYDKLFDWLSSNQTILSLTSWPESLMMRVKGLLDCFSVELEQIPKGSLSEKYKTLLRVGTFYGSFIKDDSMTEWFSPYHPLCLAYAYQLALKLKEGGSLKEFPDTTIEKLNPAGLLPIIYDQEFDYAFSAPHSSNKLWLQTVPQRKSNHSFVSKLVHEKLDDFINCFEMLFKSSDAAPLIINSIHNRHNEHIFKGIVAYFRKQKDKAKNIHINLYDDNLYQTYFDTFVEETDIVKQRSLIRLRTNEKADQSDEILAIIRSKLTYSKFTKRSDYEYSHISFFKNNEKVTITGRDVFTAKSGIACEGLIAGEASYLENQNYYTGFGLKGVNDTNFLINLAKKYNTLLKPVKDRSSSYIKNVVPVLAVKDTFKDQLNVSYDNSIWTCIIDPKVTLDFFDNKNTILIHYSDQYTNSIAYDAITVSSRVSLYKGLLQEDADELINAFNAVSGQWLLDIIKSAGKPNSSSNEKQLKEKQGIVAAYKFLAGFFLESDITWVPLSIAELIRVTGNVGLKIKDADFAVRHQNKKIGQMSDDLLFVGFKNGQMYLLPLEVKTREKGNDFTKAIKQAKELALYMTDLLGATNLKGQVYRSLFIQHVMSQVERLELYNIFPDNYFDLLKANRESYQQGNYAVVKINNYVDGFVIAFNNSRENVSLLVEKDQSTNILMLEIPFGLMRLLQTSDLDEISKKLTDKQDRPELAPYILTNTSEMVINQQGMYQNEKLGSVDALNTYADEIEDNELTQIQDSKLTQPEITPEQSDGKQEQTSINTEESLLLSQLNISQEYLALAGFIQRSFGSDISISDVMALKAEELLAKEGFGKGKLVKFENFKELLASMSFSLTVTDNDTTLVIEDYDISLTELESRLIESLDNYLNKAKDRDKEVFLRRFGIECESQTLEEIGQDHGITRERIRQIEKKAKQNFLSYLTVSQNVIKAILQANLSELREPLFQKLREKFFNDKQFYIFLEHCSGLNEGEIRQIISPNISRDYFNEFWVTHTSPAIVDDLTWYLHELLNVELAVAENQVLRWQEEGYLEINGDSVTPLRLPKVEAISNALLEFPFGESWLNIQKRAIEKKISMADITLDRLEPSLMTACDREYAYQSDRGTYRHITYLNLSEDSIQYALDTVKAKLQEYSYSNRNSVNLSVDIYEQHKFSQNYFEIRHIVRTYGETAGIYFNGKSGSDTVSLNKEFSLASQKTVLEQLFKESVKPLTKKEVASKIRSNSIGHAAFYIDTLLTDGVIVRVDESQYMHTDNAFVDFDIGQVMEHAKKFFEKEHRVIEGESLQTYFNRQLSLSFNKYLYLSLLRAYGQTVDLNLYFVQNLVSTKPIHEKGLIDFCREALELSEDNKEALEKVKIKVCAHDHVIKRVIHQATIDWPSADMVEPTIDADIDLKQEQAIEKELIFGDTNTSKIEDCRVLIGKASDTAEKVYWEYGNAQLANRHLIVFGRSGQGKTYCIQGLLMELANANCNSLVIDYTNGFLPNHLEEEFNEQVNPESHFLAQKPLGISPFRKQKQDFGGVILEEQDHIVAARIASVFNQVYSSIGEQQIATLINVIEDGVKRHGRNYDFECMLDDLREEGKTGEALANKLSPMVKSKLFDNSDTQGWKTIFSNPSSKVNIVQLASLSRDIMRLATEFTLWDLYAYACSYGQKNQPLPIVLDEVQNLDHRLESPLGKMLTEGRKYGISLILATQTLSMLAKEEQDRLFQASHKLFFAPAETEIQSYAKLLEQAVPGTDKKAWLVELAKLQKGECISVGLHRNEKGLLEQGAKVVRVSNLNAR